MAVETLKLEITADNKPAVAALQAMNNQLAKFQRALKSATDPAQVQYLQRSIEILKGRIADFSGTATTALNKAGTAVKGNTQAWLNWGRVVQDAPYGLNGIANNLTQVIPAVGALGFAFSALVAAMQFAQVGFGAWTKGFGKAKEEADKLNQSIAEETVSFQTLYRAATNANAPLEARGRAVKDLRDQYGNYLKNFSDEEIMAGKATTAYNALSDSILKVARAKAAQEQITALFTKRLAEEAKLADIAAKAEKQAADNAARRAQRGDVSLTQLERGQGIESAAVTFARASQEALKVANAIGEIDKEINRLNQSIDNNQVKPFTEDLKDAGEETSKWERQLRLLNLQLKDTKSLGLQSLVSADPRLADNQAPERVIGRPVTEMRKNGPKFLKERDFEEIQNLTDKTEGYNDAVAKAFELTNKFGGVFSDLGTALLQGQAFGEALGNVFKKLAADIAAAAIKALVFKAILSALPGGPAAASAGAAPGFGDLFKNFLGLKLSTGGITQGPTQALIGEAGPETVLPLDKLGAFVDRAARIGADSMRGNSQGMNITGEFVARGQDLVLALNRAGYNLSLRR